MYNTFKLKGECSMLVKKTVGKKESLKRRFESRSDSWDFQKDLRNEFRKLSSFLRTMMDNGIRLDGLEVEVDCHLGMDDDSVGFNLPCKKMADGNASEIEAFLEEIGDYIEDSVPNCKDGYNKYSIPDYAEAVDVEVTCVIQPMSGNSLHDIIDVFKYVIVFPFLEDEDVFDLEVIDSGFSKSLRDTKGDIARMLQHR